MENMAEAHARDAAAEREFRRLAREIDDFLNSEHTLRLDGSTRGFLQAASAGLVDKAAHIVAVWD